MATLPVGGLVSGLDTNALVEKLLNVERQPVNVLQTRQVKLKAQSTAWGDLNTRLVALEAKADVLRDAGTFFPRSVTSSEDTVATATAAAGVVTGTYTLTASALARGSIAAAGVTKSATTDTIATTDGDFTFRLGADGTEQSFAVTGTTTLDDLVAGINALNAGVKASAVNTGTAAAPAYKLTITSTSTGAANDIVIVDDPTTLAVANTQTAIDAEFSITGLGSFTRATNTFSDVLDGVTITLKAASGSADLSIDYDKSGLQTRVQNLVDAYNDVVRYIDSQSAVTKGTDGRVSSGAFSGDGVSRQLRTNLAGILRTRLSAAYQTLAEIGVTTQKDGTLTLDATRFQDKLAADPQGVSDLLAGPASSASSGIADLLSAAADTATKALTGTIAVRRDGITRSVEQLQDTIDAALQRLDKREEELRTRFQNLEQLLSRLQNTGSYLTAQLKSLGQLNQK
jgi:flagellar hook-associated protein 2